MHNRFHPYSDQQGKAKAKYKAKHNRISGADTFGDFVCAHCRAHVSASGLMSGVINRNHCPYCLWSRHLDQYQAGDRRSVCKAPMRPVGLALKQTRKKYGAGRGELMLVHQCLECGKLSANRIASDDDVDALLAVHRQGSGAMALEAEGLALLGPGDGELVRAQLLGHDAGSAFAGSRRESRMEALLSMWEE